MFIDKYGIEQCYSNGKQIHLAYCKDIFENRYSVVSNAQQQSNLNRTPTNSASQTNRNKDSQTPVSNDSTTMLKIHNENILLIDDDSQNIKIAADNGHLVYLCQENVSLVDLFNTLQEYYSKR